MEDIKTEIMKILVNKFGIEESAITLNDPLCNIGMDSVEIVELQYIVDEEFGLDHGDLLIENGDTVSLLQTKISLLRGKKENA